MELETWSLQWQKWQRGCVCRAVPSAGLCPLDGGSTSGNFLQPSQWGWIRAKPWGLWRGHREAHPPLRQYHFEALLPAGSCETSPPPSHSRMPRQILSPFPASLTSPRATVSVIWRDRVKRNRASPHYTASPQPHSMGLGLGHPLKNWDKTLSPAISTSALLLHASAHHRRAPSL